MKWGHKEHLRQEKAKNTSWNKNSKLSYRAILKKSANNNDSYPNKQILWVESKQKSDLNAANGI